jgi:hypothetical protein
VVQCPQQPHRPEGEPGSAADPTSPSLTAYPFLAHRCNFEVALGSRAAPVGTPEQLQHCPQGYAFDKSFGKV